MENGNDLEKIEETSSFTKQKWRANIRGRVCFPRGTAPVKYGRTRKDYAPKIDGWADYIRLLFAEVRVPN